MSFYGRFEQIVTWILTLLEISSGGRYIGNNGYDKARADAAIAQQKVDAPAFGKPFIANPDLVPLNVLPTWRNLFRICSLNVLLIYGIGTGRDIY